MHNIVYAADQMVKVTDLEFYTFIALALKFFVKYLLSIGGVTSWGVGVYVSPC